MLTYPHFNPIAVQIGPIAVHWYGLMYLVAFAQFWLIAQLRLKHEPYCSMTGQDGWSKRNLEDMLFLGVLGVVIGGRLGYCLFYQPGYYLEHPLEIFFVWHGGMSFHGGLVGVLISQAIYARMHNKPFLEVMDLVAPCVPLGLAVGRLGNFINGELWGRAADPSLPWSMIFPQSGSNIARHPSQIYQALLEGLLLFIILWLYARSPHRRMGQVSGVFLAGYGVFRFIAEYFREPDSYLGLLAMGFSMGQWLCIPMIAIGVVMWIWATKHQPTPNLRVKGV
jgi:phosphatidylglycerol:prolipoprotein diacylglycerol transferase